MPSLLPVYLITPKEECQALFEEINEKYYELRVNELRVTNYKLQVAGIYHLSFIIHNL